MKPKSCGLVTPWGQGITLSFVDFEVIVGLNVAKWLTPRMAIAITECDRILDLRRKAKGRISQRANKGGPKTDCLVQKLLQDANINIESGISPKRALEILNVEMKTNKRKPLSEGAFRTRLSRWRNQ